MFACVLAKTELECSEVTGDYCLLGNAELHVMRTLGRMRTCIRIHVPLLKKSLQQITQLSSNVLGTLGELHDTL